MVAVLFDTNILIDYLNGVSAARDEIEGADDRAISVISWMEVLVGATPETEAVTHLFLQALDVVHINEAVARRAVILRRQNRVKLPDAIIWASALETNRVLITRDLSDFPADAVSVMFPYRLR